MGRVGRVCDISFYPEEDVGLHRKVRVVTAKNFLEWVSKIDMAETVGN